MKTPLRLLGLIVALALVTAGCGSTSPYAAVVAGARISQSALDDELEAIAANDVYLAQLEQQGGAVLGQGKGSFDTAFVARVLTRQILLELVHQEVAQRGLEISDAERQVARQEVSNQLGGDQVFQGFPEQYRNTLVRRQAEVVALQETFADTPINDQAVSEYYEQNKAQQFSETCVSHILFAPQPAGERPDLPADADASALIAEAKRAKARIEAGAAFEDVAAELSKDPSGQSGGSLGCVGPGNFVPEFEAAMDQLQPGQVSDPVRTQFGIHLIKVTERRVKPLDEVEDDVRQALLGQAQGNFQTWLFQTLGEVKIDVNPRYGRFTTEGGSPQIVPPDRPTTTTTAPAGGGGAGASTTTPSPIP